MKYYTEDHLWVEMSGEEVIVGISEYMADELSDIEYVDLPGEDDDFIIGDRVGELRTNCEKVVLYSPVSGTVSQINESVYDEPTIINDSPEEKGWLFHLCDFDNTELDDMMSEDAYLKYLDKNCR